MKKYVKHLIIATLVLLSASLDATAQAKTTDRKEFIQNVSLKMFNMDLQSRDVPGFVESALYALVQCKDRYPDLDYSKILSTVDKVAKESNDPANAYKAYLVSMYFTHNSEIQVTPNQYEDNHDQLFKQIADQLETKFLASNIDGTMADKK